MEADNAAYEYEKPPPYAPPGQHPPPATHVTNQPGPPQGGVPYPGTYPAAYPGAYPHPIYGSQPSYGTTTTVTVHPRDIIVVGGCPVCRIGILETDFTCLGILCALFFFPLGVLFCLVMRQQRCANCGAIFG